MALLLRNDAISTLAGSISSGATTLSVQGADASKFPSPGAGDWFPLTIVDAGGNKEIVRATARSGAVITVARAQEGTTALAFAAGASVSLRLTAGAIAGFAQASDLSTLAATVAALNSTNLGFTPAGNIAATTIQAAIVELDTEKIAWAVAITDGTFPSAVRLDTNVATLKATTTYIDTNVDRNPFKKSVRVATTGPLPTNSRTGNVLTASSNGILTVDGVNLVLGDDVLVKDEATQTNNGIYRVTTAGTVSVPYVLTRRQDCDDWLEVPNATVWIVNGTALADQMWMTLAAPGGTINSTAMVWTYVMSGYGGDGGAPGQYSKLVVSATSNTAFSVSADALTVTDSSGRTRVIRNVTLTGDISTGSLDTGSEAGSTWYHVHVFSDGANHVAKISTSPTAPAAQTGYSYRMYVGSIYNDGSSNFRRSRQVGNRVQYIAGANPSDVTGLKAASGVAGDLDLPTYVAIDISSFVPSTAGVVRGILSIPGASEAFVSPNNSYGPRANAAGKFPAVHQQAGTSNGVQQPFDFVIEGALSVGLYWVSRDTNNSVAILGFDINL